MIERDQFENAVKLRETLIRSYLFTLNKDGPTERDLSIEEVDLVLLALTSLSGAVRARDDASRLVRNAIEEAALVVERWSLPTIHTPSMWLIDKAGIAAEIRALVADEDNNSSTATTGVPLEALSAPGTKDLMTREERLVWILGDLMNAVENYFGTENPKRLGHINSTAIRIIDEVLADRPAHISQEHTPES
ncbi:hypothetical protein [Bradyrhizobium liaoningense]